MSNPNKASAEVDPDLQVLANEIQMRVLKATYPSPDWDKCDTADVRHYLFKFNPKERRVLDAAVKACLELVSQ